MKKLICMIELGVSIRFGYPYTEWVYPKYFGSDIKPIKYGSVYGMLLDYFGISVFFKWTLGFIRINRKIQFFVKNIFYIILI